jgi:hypothetical protein
MALATTLRLTKWAMARAARAIATNAFAASAVILASAVAAAIYNGNEEGYRKGGKGNGDGNKGVGQGTVTATKRAMATAESVAGDEESAGNGDCDYNSN